MKDWYPSKKDSNGVPVIHSTWKDLLRPHSDKICSFIIDIMQNI